VSWLFGASVAGRLRTSEPDPLVGVVVVARPELDEEFGTLEVVAELDAGWVVAVVDPPDEHDARTMMAQLTSASPTIRRVMVT
jgi:hypothetical protein